MRLCLDIFRKEAGLYLLEWFKRIGIDGDVDKLEILCNGYVKCYNYFGR